MLSALSTAAPREPCERLKGGPCLLAFRWAAVFVEEERNRTLGEIAISDEASAAISPAWLIRLVS